MTKKKRCVDHTGQEFESVYEMCRYWGINQNTYYWRIRAGASVEEALSKKAYVGGGSAKPCRDHTGREFRSISDMCRAWGVDRYTYSTRRRRGCSVEEALTGPEDRRTWQWREAHGR